MTAKTKEIESEAMTDLIAKKHALDLEMSTLMKSFKIHEDQMNKATETLHSGLRIISAVDNKSLEFKMLMDKRDELIEHNKKILELEPDMFKSDSYLFREPQVIENVVRITVTVNSANASAVRTTEQLVARYDREIKRRKKKIEKEDNQEVIEELQQEIAVLTRERNQFALTPNKKYRLRTQSHKDVIAICRRAGMGESDKIRVNASGLIIAKNKDCTINDITASDKGYRRGSIYEQLIPIQNSLGLTGSLYDEELAELIRQKHKNVVDGNSEAIRPK